MTISLRLDAELAKRLDIVARQRGVSKSEFVRQCLVVHLGQEENQPTAWELGKHLFGRYRSGQRGRAEASERIVRERIRAKSHRR